LTVGSFLAFSLSRFFGRPLTDKFVDAKTMARFDYLLHHKGAFLVFLLFLIPGFPKDYLCYILGWAISRPWSSSPSRPRGVYSGPCSSRSGGRS